MTDLMDHGFDGLCLAHVGLDKNTLFRKIAAAISTARKRLNGNGVRGNAAQSRNHALILCYIAGQLFYKLRQRFSLRLAHIEYRNGAETHALHPLNRGGG